MPVYIKMIKDAQRKSLITDLPLYDTNLLATATKPVLALQKYPYKYREWERNPKDAKTWAAWKLRCNWAYKLRKCAHQDLDVEIQFGSANDAMGAQPSAPRHFNPSAGEPIEYKQLEVYLDNLAHANTNKKAVRQQLSSAFALLTTTNATLVEEIKAIPANKKYFVSLACSANITKSVKGKEKGLWTKANPGRYIVGGN